MLRIKNGERLVFIGDSITHCDRDTVLPPLGWGYVRWFATLLAARHPGIDVEIVNTGIGGDTVLDLDRRFEVDALSHTPDWLFIMIGINDVLFRVSRDHGHRAVDDATYRATYERLASRARSAGIPHVVLVEPNAPERGELQPSNQAILRITRIIEDVAARHELEICRIFRPFLEALDLSGGGNWMIDCPHPALKGHALMALAVLDHVGW